MDRKRSTVLFLLLMLSAWRFWENYYNDQETYPTLHQPLRSAEPWTIYIPDSYGNVCGIYEMLLFGIVGELLDDSMLFIWNQCVEYEVHYEWKMNVTSATLEYYRTVTLTLTSGIQSPLTITMGEHQNLMIAVWFHPRSYLNILQFFIDFRTDRRSYIAFFFVGVLLTFNITLP